MKNHQQIFDKIIKNEHAIGNHTHNHLNRWKTDSNSYIKNIELAENTFLNANSNITNSKIFRPPYGKIKTSQSAHLIKNGYKIIMWDVISRDFDTELSGEKILRNCIKHTENGSIIVFHDSVKAEKNLKCVLPKFLAYFYERRYEFKKII